MSELSTMPYVTVEQVNRFRDEALKQLAEAKAYAAKIKGLVDTFESSLKEMEEQLKRYEGAVEITDTRVEPSLGKTGILKAFGLPKEFIGQPVTVWVKRREG